MNVLDNVLTLRPTSVVARLGSGSRLPVLNPREMTRALEKLPVALPCLPVPLRCMLPGILAAARSGDSVLGLSCPHPLADRGSPERFMAMVQQEAEAAGHARPLFLQAGPVRVTRSEEEALGQLQQGVFRLVDSGFSLVSLDVTRLAAPAAVAAVQRLSPVVVERELALEVTLPRVAPGEELLGARVLLDGLQRKGLAVRFLRVSETMLGEEGQDVPFLRELVAQAAHSGVGVAVGEAGQRSLRGLSTYVAAGVKKVECAAPLEALACAALPAEERAGLAQKAERAGLPVGELLGVLGGQLAPLDERAQARLEALAFAEATGVLSRLGAVGTGWRSMCAIVDRRSEP